MLPKLKAKKSTLSKHLYEKLIPINEKNAGKSIRENIRAGGNKTFLLLLTQLPILLLTIN